MLVSFFKYYFTSYGRAVGKVTGYGLDDWKVGVRVSVWPRIFASPYRPDQFWGNPDSHKMGTGGSLPGDKAGEACSWPFTSN
jgi:hypothetical protein